MPLLNLGIAYFECVLKLILNGSDI